jgi:hypothetical protein
VAATTDEWQRYPVAGAPVIDSLAHGLHDSRQLMPGNVGHHDIRIVSLPAVPVAQADAARHYLQHYAAFRRDRIRNLLYLQWACKRPVNDGSHAASFSSAINAVIVSQRGAARRATHLPELTSRQSGIIVIIQRVLVVGA